VSEARREFKELVKAAHARGIEVILDVVFNHSAEGNERGPALSFRGLDNRAYYMLAPGGEYYNYSGCGNTLNANHPVAARLVADCLRHWVAEYHVDGFRFDLASILTRAPSAWQATPAQGHAAPGADGPGGAGGYLPEGGAGAPTGTPLSDPPLIEAISRDPLLRGTKLIAEAWDCDGLNQVGAFPHYGGRWAEWNGRFRDTVRAFVKGSDGSWAGAFASAVMGSPNIYAEANPADSDWWGCNGGRQWKGRRGPQHSINFVTAHDGFSLADLVAYNEKHNAANGEGNNDGEAHNLSWNCGVEGPSADAAVGRLRQRQTRNLACALLLRRGPAPPVRGGVGGAHGVPMLTMGDECGHTKGGNNNTYCHDSPLNWLDWGALGADADGFARFMRRLINFRRATPLLRRGGYVSDADVAWHAGS
jgi:isoamylase